MQILPHSFMSAEVDILWAVGIVDRGTAALDAAQLIWMFGRG
jgi:hypothetical protein